MNSKKLAIGVVIIAWMAFLFSFVDRLSWTPIMPLAMKDLGLTKTQAGSFMTAFYIGYVITQLPGGLLTDRFGYRKVVLGSFFVMGVFTALMSTVHSYEMGIALRVLAGLGSGAVFSACVRAIFDWFPGKGRSTAMGFFMTASSLGVSVVNLFVPTVAEASGWQASFLVAGLLPIIGLVLGFFILKEKTPSTVQRSQNAENASRFWKDVAGLFKNRNLMITGFSGFCAMWATWGVATWANSYMKDDLKISLVEAGVIMSVYGLTALLCKPIIGILADVLKVRRKTLLFIVLIIFGPVLLWFGTTTSVSMLYVAGAILGIAAFIYSPVMNTFIGELVDQRLVGTATGFVNTIWQLGSLISPIAVGAVLDATGSYFYAFLTLAIGPILAALLILLVHEKAAAKVSPSPELNKVGA
ncbi:MFS transporter [Brevibacillus fulvus]|uniref:MFS family permease n=1 Tax=Brevibacillus fulvus TaxID=1125967 RepID=A0A939BSP3_9BACL|nr:MFS transporter [Brevibacillus fulvus]MBM7590942.1 MFS family permease [Brevibacillus fulvus]